VQVLWYFPNVGWITVNTDGATKGTLGFRTCWYVISFMLYWEFTMLFMLRSCVSLLLLNMFN